MSSTVVRSNQPPHSSNALIRQTPAVPLKPKKLMNTPFTCCSTSKWNDRFMFWRRVSRFSSLLTNDHRACTRPSSGLSCDQQPNHFLKTRKILYILCVTVYSKRHNFNKTEVIHELWSFRSWLFLRKSGNLLQYIHFVLNTTRCHWFAYTKEAMNGHFLFPSFL